MYTTIQGLPGLGCRPLAPGPAGLGVVAAVPVPAWWLIFSEAGNLVPADRSERTNARGQGGAGKIDVLNILYI